MEPETNYLNLFDDAAIQKTVDFLTNYCKDGKYITCPNLCNGLNIDPELHTVMGTMIRSGYISGFKTYMGRGRGINKDNLPTSASKKKEKVNIKWPEKTAIPDYFLDELEEMLEERCVFGVKISRAAIAEDMETLVKNTEATISQALKMSRFDAYGTQRGPGGGIFLKEKPAIIVEQKAIDAPEAPKPVIVTPEKSIEEPEATIPPVTKPIQSDIGDNWFV